MPSSHFTASLLKISIIILSRIWKNKASLGPQHRDNIYLVNMFHSALLLFLAAAGFAHSTNPKPPSLTYLYSANITVGTPIPIGNVPLGTRVVIPVTGGSFSGPKLSGMSA